MSLFIQMENHQVHPIVSIHQKSGVSWWYRCWYCCWAVIAFMLAMALLAKVVDRGDPSTPPQPPPADGGHDDAQGVTTLDENADRPPSSSSSSTQPPGFQRPPSTRRLESLGMGSSSLSSSSSPDPASIKTVPSPGKTEVQIETLLTVPPSSPLSPKIINVTDLPIKTPRKRGGRRGNKVRACYQALVVDAEVQEAIEMAS